MTYISPKKIVLRREQKKHLHKVGSLGMTPGFTGELIGSGCLWIEGNPVEELRAGLDPYCGAERVEGKPYCACHCARAFVPEKKKREVSLDDAA